MTAAAFYLFEDRRLAAPDEEEDPRRLTEERCSICRRAHRARAPRRSKSRPGLPELYFVGFAPDASQEFF